MIFKCMDIYKWYKQYTGHLATLRILYFPPVDITCSSTAHKQCVWNYKIYILTT